MQCISGSIAITYACMKPKASLITGHTPDVYNKLRTQGASGHSRGWGRSNGQTQETRALVLDLQLTHSVMDSKPQKLSALLFPQQ